jgi:hypothetical protein
LTTAIPVYGVHIRCIEAGQTRLASWRRGGGIVTGLVAPLVLWHNTWYPMVGHMIYSAAQCRVCDSCAPIQTAVLLTASVAILPGAWEARGTCIQAAATCSGRPHVQNGRRTRELETSTLRTCHRNLLPLPPSTSLHLPPPSSSTAMVMSRPRDVDAVVDMRPSLRITYA